VTKYIFDKFMTKKLSFVVSLFVIFMIPVSAAYAGIFSFLGGIFDKYSTVSYVAEVNSQNVALLQAAVNSDPNPAKGGGDITIVDGEALLPGSGPLGTIADVNDAGSSKDQISVYVVREGDSLSQIAEMFNVSVNTIIWANDIGRAGLIRQGQTLEILPVTGVEYTIKSGDTVKSIATKYKGDIEEILIFNGIEDGAVLSVGDTIVVPGGQMEAPASSAGYSVIVKGTSGPSYDGYYLRPVEGGRRSQGLHGYNGIDIAASVGTPILAAASGEVVISRYSAGNPWFGGYGNYIVVEHGNGTQTLYAHLSGNIVNRGWRVVKGQVIGYMGSTGRSTGSHLHFEVRGAKNPF